MNCHQRKEETVYLLSLELLVMLSEVYRAICCMKPFYNNILINTITKNIHEHHIESM